MTKNLVTIKLAAEILKLSVATLRRWDKAGRLKAHRDPTSRYRLYNISALEKLKSSAPRWRRRALN